VECSSHTVPSKYDDLSMKYYKDIYPENSYLYFVQIVFVLIEILVYKYVSKHKFTRSSK